MNPCFAEQEGLVGGGLQPIWVLSARPLGEGLGGLDPFLFLFCIPFSDAMCSVTIPGHPGMRFIKSINKKTFLVWQDDGVEDDDLRRNDHVAPEDGDGRIELA